MSSLVTPQYQMFFIGLNKHGEFGLDHIKDLQKITPCPKASIQKVFAGPGHQESVMMIRRRSPHILPLSISKTTILK